MTRPARVTIDLAALTHNLAQVRRHAGGARVMAVIKANAYGHGAVAIGRALAAAGADALAVASLEEAGELRAAGLACPITLLEGLFSVDELRQALQWRLHLVAHHERQIAWLESALAATDWRPVVWLKVETGMHRLGLAPAQIDAMVRRLRALPGPPLSLRLMSHLANAGNADDAYTMQQTAVFDQVCAAYPDSERSLANSAAILLWPQTHYEWVRPGIMLYGISPLPDKTGAQLGLRPVMTASSRLIAVKQCRRGESVGYNRLWTCPEDMPVGVVAFGYGDGYPRNCRQQTPVRVNDGIAPLIGQISMDMLTVDLRAIAQAKVGDPVQLWGGSLPVETVAACAQTIPYELVCRITRRVQVEYAG